ncbi:hypothetical protein CI109_105428 [Kwoniella shandongensis]|uniref:Uncharacterized protein n=1 Tax=Kwoniella shandongensis TaxID=1734106 RepID=A0A5M6C7T0_9TREE|nr:uncharacterized protein CI109_002149 [Kwoniella shandongensis]KAA5529259.1 hypothetical protein CI109_002149 [Kwoniella shandongensis]
MQGLVHYSDDSSPEPSTSIAGPSRLRDQVSTASPSTSATPKGKSKPPSGIVLTPNQIAATQRPSKRPRRSPQPTNKTDKATSSTSNQPENLTHTAQSDLPKASRAEVDKIMAEARVKYGSNLERLSEDETLQMMIRPSPINGVEDWGIPPEVDPNEASPQLKAKVENFLRLKYERGEHINTRLLSSSSFANPHIYSKLVEFVSIDERATAFPSSGWLTRRNLESLLPTYGPSALSSAQKAKEEAVRASQAIGTRKEIGFAPAKHKERDEKRRERERERGRDDKREKNGASWDRKRDRDRR